MLEGDFEAARDELDEVLKEGNRELVVIWRGVGGGEVGLRCRDQGGEEGREEGLQLQERVSAKSEASSRSEASRESRRGLH